MEIKDYKIGEKIPCGYPCHLETSKNQNEEIKFDEKSVLFIKAFLRDMLDKEGNTVENWIKQDWYIEFPVRHLPEILEAYEKLKRDNDVLNGGNV